MDKYASSNDGMSTVFQRMLEMFYKDSSMPFQELCWYGDLFAYRYIESLKVDLLNCESSQDFLNLNCNFNLKVLNLPSQSNQSAKLNGIHLTLVECVSNFVTLKEIVVEIEENEETIPSNIKSKLLKSIGQISQSLKLLVIAYPILSIEARHILSHAKLMFETCIDSNDLKQLMGIFYEDFESPCDCLHTDNLTAHFNIAIKSLLNLNDKLPQPRFYIFSQLFNNDTFENLSNFVSKILALINSEDSTRTNQLKRKLANDKEFQRIFGSKNCHDFEDSDDTIELSYEFSSSSQSTDKNLSGDEAIESLGQSDSINLETSNKASDMCLLSLPLINIDRLSMASTLHPYQGIEWLDNDSPLDLFESCFTYNPLENNSPSKESDVDVCVNSDESPTSIKLDHEKCHNFLKMMSRNLSVDDATENIAGNDESVQEEEINEITYKENVSLHQAEIPQENQLLLEDITSQSQYHEIVSNDINCPKCVNEGAQVSLDGILRLNHSDEIDLSQSKLPEIDSNDANIPIFVDTGAQFSLDKILNSIESDEMGGTNVTHSECIDERAQLHLNDILSQSQFDEVDAKNITVAECNNERAKLSLNYFLYPSQSDEMDSNNVTHTVCVDERARLHLCDILSQSQPDEMDPNNVTHPVCVDEVAQLQLHKILSPSQADEINNVTLAECSNKGAQLSLDDTLTINRTGEIDQNPVFPSIKGIISECANEMTSSSKEELSNFSEGVTKSTQYNKQVNPGSPETHIDQLSQNNCPFSPQNHLNESDFGELAIESESDDPEQTARDKICDPDFVPSTLPDSESSSKDSNVSFDFRTERNPPPSNVSRNDNGTSYGAIDTYEEELSKDTLESEVTDDNPFLDGISCYMEGSDGPSLTSEEEASVSNGELYLSSSENSWEISSNDQPYFNCSDVSTDSRDTSLNDQLGISNQDKENNSQCLVPASFQENVTSCRTENSTASPSLLINPDLPNGDLSPNYKESPLILSIIENDAGNTANRIDVTLGTELVNNGVQLEYDNVTSGLDSSKTEKNTRNKVKTDRISDLSGAELNNVCNLEEHIISLKLQHSHQIAHQTSIQELENLNPDFARDEVNQTSIQELNNLDTDLVRDKANPTSILELENLNTDLTRNEAHQTSIQDIENLKQDLVRNEVHQTSIQEIENLKQDLARNEAHQTNIQEIENLKQDLTRNEVHQTNIQELENLNPDLTRNEVHQTNIQEHKNLNPDFARNGGHQTSIQEIEKLKQDLARNEVHQNSIQELENLNPDLTRNKIHQTNIQKLENLNPDLARNEVHQTSIQEIENLKQDLTRNEVHQTNIQEHKNLNPDFARNEGHQTSIQEIENLNPDLTRNKIHQTNIQELENLNPDLAMDENIVINCLENVSSQKTSDVENKEMREIITFLHQSLTVDTIKPGALSRSNKLNKINSTMPLIENQHIIPSNLPEGESLITSNKSRVTIIQDNSPNNLTCDVEIYCTQMESVITKEMVCPIEKESGELGPMKILQNSGERSVDKNHRVHIVKNLQKLALNQPEILESKATNFKNPEGSIDGVKNHEDTLPVLKSLVESLGVFDESQESPVSSAKTLTGTQSNISSDHDKLSCLEVFEASGGLVNEKSNTLNELENNGAKETRKDIALVSLEFLEGEKMNEEDKNVVEQESLMEMDPLDHTLTVDDSIKDIDNAKTPQESDPSLLEGSNQSESVIGSLESICGTPLATSTQVNDEFNGGTPLSANTSSDKQSIQPTEKNNQRIERQDLSQLFTSSTSCGNSVKLSRRRRLFDPMANPMLMISPCKGNVLRKRQRGADPNIYSTSSTEKDSTYNKQIRNLIINPPKITKHLSLEISRKCTSPLNIDPPNKTFKNGRNVPKRVKQNMKPKLPLPALLSDNESTSVNLGKNEESVTDMKSKDLPQPCKTMPPSPNISANLVVRLRRLNESDISSWSDSDIIKSPAKRATVTSASNIFVSVTKELQAIDENPVVNPPKPKTLKNFRQDLENNSSASQHSIITLPVRLPTAESESSDYSPTKSSDGNYFPLAQRKPRDKINKRKIKFTNSKHTLAFQPKRTTTSSRNDELQSNEKDLKYTKSNLTSELLDTSTSKSSDCSSNEEFSEKESNCKKRLITLSRLSRKRRHHKDEPNAINCTKQKSLVKKLPIIKLARLDASLTSNSSFETTKVHSTVQNNHTDIMLSKELDTVDQGTNKTNIKEPFLPTTLNPIVRIPRLNSANMFVPLFAKDTALRPCFEPQSNQTLKTTSPKPSSSESVSKIFNNLKLKRRDRIPGLEADSDSTPNSVTSSPNLDTTILLHSNIKLEDENDVISESSDEVDYLSDDTLPINRTFSEVFSDDEHTLYIKANPNTPLLNEMNRHTKDGTSDVDKNRTSNQEDAPNDLESTVNLIKVCSNTATDEGNKSRNDKGSSNAKKDDTNSKHLSENDTSKVDAKCGESSDFVNPRQVKNVLLNENDSHSNESEKVIGNTSVSHSRFNTRSTSANQTNRIIFNPDENKPSNSQSGTYKDKDVTKCVKNIPMYVSDSADSDSDDNQNVIASDKDSDRRQDKKKRRGFQSSTRLNLAKQFKNYSPPGKNLHRRKPWSEEEEELLYVGVRDIGTGRWHQIANKYGIKRTVQQLYDKWRNLQKGNNMLKVEIRVKDKRKKAPVVSKVQSN